VRLAAAKIWSGWEGATSKLLPDAAFAGHYEEDEFALAFARIEAHYFVHRGFSKVTISCCSCRSDSRHPRRDRAGPLRCGLSHGERLALHRAWPEADLVITPDSGHSAFDPAQYACPRRGCRQVRQLLKEDASSFITAHVGGYSRPVEAPPTSLL